MSWMLDYVGALPNPPESRQRPRTATADLQAAVSAFNRDHERDWGRAGGTCPICQHSGCFGNAGGKLANSGRWACFSANHGAVGRRLGACWHGDALDVDAHNAGRTRIEHLTAEGYLHTRPHQRPQEREAGIGATCTTSEIELGQAALARLTRADVVTALGHEPTEYEREWLHERAGILCFDAGLLMDEAEREALRLLLALKGRDEHDAT